MDIIEPKAKLLIQRDIYDHITKCARVCYGKTDGKLDSKTFVENLIKRGHISMLRHATIYFIIDKNCMAKDIASQFYNIIINNKTKICGIDISNEDGIYYIIINGQFAHEHKDLMNIWKIFEVNEYDFKYTNFKRNNINYSKILNKVRYTIEITTQISTSRELNRVSPNNISEKSTRYVYENGTICRPWWLDKNYNNECNKNIEGKYNYLPMRLYLDTCNYTFLQYKHLVDLGFNREDARGILPLDTATKCIYTYSLEEWNHILNLRLRETTGKAHPNAKIIASKIEEILPKL